jgi:hypothetical protein
MFFADSRTLFLGGVGWESVVDVQTGQRTATPRKAFDPKRGDPTFPAGDRAFLVAHYETPPYRTQTLALVEFPGYREIVKVSYATEARKPGPMMGATELSTEAQPKESDNRRILAYAFDNVLVCRRLEDLGLLWSRPFEPELEAYKLAVSADGSRIAAGVADRASGHPPRQYYIGVYDADTGDRAARLPLNGTEWVALSPNGKLIAVAGRESGTNGETLPTVHIHEVSSGARLASVTHDRIKRGRHQWLVAGCTIGFTSDGKYLVTSGMSTKVWTLGE